MKGIAQLQQDDFENEVRRIARYLWPYGKHQGSAIIDGLERDGVFRSDSEINLVEATVSKSKEKAKQDVGKLAKLAQKMRTQYPTCAINCWFVTKDEPTPQQREIADHAPYPVTALSFHQFCAKLVDVREYLQVRNSAPFGSIEDPRSGHFADSTPYIRLDLSCSDGSELAFHNIVQGCIDGKRYLVLGDYGAGKSMTLRAVFKELATRYCLNLKTATSPFVLIYETIKLRKILWKCWNVTHEA